MLIAIFNTFPEKTIQNTKTLKYKYLRMAHLGVR
jgi:hypothetical protein